MVGREDLGQWTCHCGYETSSKMEVQSRKWLVDFLGNRLAILVTHELDIHEATVTSDMFE